MFVGEATGVYWKNFTKLLDTRHNNMRGVSCFYSRPYMKAPLSRGCKWLTKFPERMGGLIYIYIYIKVYICLSQLLIANIEIKT